MSNNNNNNDQDSTSNAAPENDKHNENKPLHLLTDEMRSATRKDHDQSDRLVNLKLALVLTSPTLYGEALGLFLPVFETLESILERTAKGHPTTIGKLTPLLPILRRTPGLRADLAYYLTRERRDALENGWNQPPNDETNNNTCHAAMAEYVQHLLRLETEHPVAILAYAYHLYGGVLAGGQIISRGVRKAMGLAKDKQDGVQVFHVQYDGTGISNKGLFQKVKTIFNEEMEFSAQEKQILIQEGKEVFRLNNALVGTVKSTEAWQNAADSLCKKVMLQHSMSVDEVLTECVGDTWASALC